MKIKDARSLSAAAQEAIRQRAVAAVLDGMKQTKVAKVFGVTRQALGKWLKAYRENGFKSLKARPQGRPKGGSLAPWQAAQIVKTLINRTPDQPDFPSCLWTRAAVCYLIEQRFEMQLSVWTVGRYLKRWGFTPQKPIRRALEKDPKSVKKWLAEDYPAIRKEAKKEKAQIYWCDEMGLRSDQFAGRSFSKRGRKPVVSRTGKRFGCNMISAVANVGTLYFMLFKENFDADIFLSFLKRLVRQSQTTVFLIVDRHPVHRAHKVQQWLDKHSEHIRLFFLPVYSPELNPNELLNQDVKGNAVGKRGARNLRELLKNVRSYLFRRQRQPHIIRRYFIEKHVRYAAT